MKKIGWTVTCILLAGFFTSAMGAEREGWPKNVIIGGTSLGGSNYTVAAAWADMIRKHMGITATATTSGGSVMSIRHIEKGDIHMATCTGDTTYQAYRGLPPWDGKKDVAAVIWAHPVAWHWAVRANKPYKTLKDLMDKAVMQAYPWPASPTSELVFLSFVESAGFTLDKVRSRVRPLVNAADQIRSLKDGKVEAIMYGGAPETPQWVALSNEIDVQFIGPSEEEIKFVHQKYPYFENIPVRAGVYKGQNYPLNTIAHRMGIVLQAALPESFVYEMTRALFENMEELHKYHENYLRRWYTFKYLTDFLEVCPLHPGTVKYLKEKGKWSAELEARQKKQVAARDYPARLPAAAGWK